MYDLERLKQLVLKAEPESSAYAPGVLSNKGERMLVAEIDRLKAALEKMKEEWNHILIATTMGTGAGGFPHDTTVSDRLKMCEEAAREALGLPLVEKEPGESVENGTVEGVFVEEVTERMCGFVTASTVRPATKEDIVNAKRLCEQGKCPHTCVVDIDCYPYWIRKCYTCGEGLGTV